MCTEICTNLYLFRIINIGVLEKGDGVLILNVICSAIICVNFV